MVFQSYIFILAFLPLSLLGYFCLQKIGHKSAQVFLLVMSLWFCAYVNIRYSMILACGILINYAFSRVLNHFNRSALSKGVLAFAVLLNAGALFYCKYWNFFLESLNAAFSRDYPLTEIILPLGISFYTFQQIAYLVDSYRGETGNDTLLEYALFVAFFPKLTQGPIVLQDEFMEQLRDASRFHAKGENLAAGLQRFAIGLFKKVILADTLGKIVAVAYGGVEILTTSDVLITMISYTLQLYFDFSGYCDMAEGIGLMFNLYLPANFNSPLKAVSILDFWNRWHLTLTRFLRKYIYFPLGGSRKGTARTYINIMIIFLLSGLWHGANWTFVLWGALHGLFEILTRACKQTWEKIPKALAWFFTFLFVSAAFLIFRADSVGQAYIMFRKVTKLESFAVSPLLLEGARMPEFVHLETMLGIDTLMEGYLWVYLVALLVIGMGIVLFGKNCRERETKYSIGSAIATVVMLVWPILSLSEITTFIYANF